MMDVVLGAIDVFAGVILIANGIPLYSGSGFILTFALFMFAKVVWNYLSSKRPGFFDFLDTLAGILLMLLFLGIANPLYAIAGTLMVLKGLYLFILGFTGGKK